MRGRQDHERAHGRRTGLATGTDAPSAGTDGMPESTEELLSALSGLVEQTRERITVEQGRVDLAVALQRHMLPPELPRLDRLRLAVLATGDGHSSLLFLVSPLLIWAAFRFRLSGAAPCALAASTLAIVAATRRTGPFAHHGLLTNTVTLQAFNGVTALTALLLSAVVAERDRTHQEIRRAVAELRELVAEGRNGGR